MTVIEKLDLLAEQLQKWGYQPQPSAGSDQLSAFVDRCLKELGTDVPSRYLDVLRRMNGADEDGLTIYASETVRNVNSTKLGREFTIVGFVEQNLEYRMDRQEYHDYLIFAETGMYVYGVTLTSGTHFKQPHDSEVPSAVYGSFDEMLSSALDSILETE